MKKSILTFLILIAFSCLSFAQKNFKLLSPDGKITAEVTIGKTIEYSVSHQEDLLLEKSPVSVRLTDGTTFGENPRLIKATKRTVNDVIETLVYKKNKISDNFNELNLSFKGGYNLVFRTYNDGVAYRFSAGLNKPFQVENEQAVFNFAGNPKVYVAYVDDSNGRKDTFEKQFNNSFENQYQYIPLAEWNPKRLAFLPLVIESKNGKKICITESDLLNYPGMYLNGSGANSLRGIFAPYPKEVEQGGHNRLQGLVKSREAYIAGCDAKTDFPWRILIVAQKDYELANNDMVYKLASPSKLTDTSWIKPGKVAWDWWNDWNIKNVDFQAGINNDTYKYYIDFASKYGIEYVILDEGWAVNLQADLFQVVPEIDLKELVAYAKSKNVDLILWAGYYAFNKDIEGICKHYSDMGIKGFKVDFMDRDDQHMVDFYHRAAQVAAKYHMLLDFHGAFKPNGLQRTYPNVINFEGVFGLEQMKWVPSSVDQVTYDVTIPFIRMVAGPLDYTQGAMRNANKNNFRAVYT